MVIYAYVDLIGVAVRTAFVRVLIKVPTFNQKIYRL